LITNYSLNWKTPNGNMIASFDHFTRMEFAYGEMQVGALDLVLPARFYKPSDFSVDQIIEIYRSADSGPMILEGERAWFLRDWEFRDYKVFLKAYDNNFLLDGRNIEYKAKTAQAKKTGAADDMMKAIVRENIGALCTDTTRILSDFTVQADSGSGPTLTDKEFSLNNLLTTLQSLHTAALDSGVYISFEVVYLGGGKFEFRTYKDRRGANHGISGDTLTFSEAYYNLKDISYKESHSGEKTQCIAAGKGQDAARVWGSATSDGLNKSKWNRREVVLDGRQSDDSAVLDKEASEQLTKYRAKVAISGTVVQAPGCRYEIEYGYGDMLAAEAYGQVVDCRLSTVHGIVDEQSRETIDLKLSGEVPV
jgi:hypothetical protein